MENLKFFTLPLDGYSGTITYLVAEEQAEADGSMRILLSHPLCPNVLIPFKASSANELEAAQTQTQGKSDLQKWVEHVVKKSKDYLDVWTRQNAESLALLLVVNRRLTNAQKNQLAKISGKIATYFYNHDLSLAIRATKENIALLDGYNRTLFETIVTQLSRVGKDGKGIQPSDGQRNTLFNIAGIALSQIES